LSSTTSLQSPTLIIGLGKTGLSCVRYLSRLGIKDIRVWDASPHPPALPQLQQEFPTIPFYSGEFSITQCLKFAVKQIILSPGVDSQLPVWQQCREQGIAILGDVELFAQTVRAPIVAITGTNAKGTVTSLVGKMAECAQISVRVGGNIGIPLLDLLYEPEPDLFVIELSSFQLEITYSLKPAASIILNISGDHLDRYPNLQSYVAAKQGIFHASRYVIYNRHEPLTQPLAQGLNYNSISSFGLDEPCAGTWGIRQQAGQAWLAYGQELLLAVSELKIKGRHHWLNALAALALGTAVSLPRVAMLQALCNFSGLPFRCQYIATINQVEWYNDSKGTNVAATLAAIQSVAETISGKIVLLAGGVAKGADFTPLQTVAEQYLRYAVLFGRDAVHLANALSERVVIKPVSDLRQAILLAKQLAKAGDAVLLSPACASFDQFRNAEERGEIFTHAVKELLATCNP
jgi:UDP-N-acetylmuramoylalanine--D-glutamate ligase